jgi:hypothetical protein
MIAVQHVLRRALSTLAVPSLFVPDRRNSTANASRKYYGIICIEFDRAGTSLVVHQSLDGHTQFDNVFLGGFAHDRFAAVNLAG